MCIYIYIYKYIHKFNFVSGIRLHPGSAVTPVTISTEDNDPPRYEINVSGTDESKKLTILGSQEVKWQLSFPSEKVQQDWLVALQNARDFSNTLEKSEVEQLEDIAHKMRNNVDACIRLFRFKLLPRCFIGRRAVLFISENQGCTKSQAVVIGQKLLNLGLIQHITNEHVFCNKKLFYQFPPISDVISPPCNPPRLPSTSSPRGSRKSFRTENNEELERTERALIEKMSMNAEELSQVKSTLKYKYYKNMSMNAEELSQVKSTLK
jgi:hypothetical protein